MSKKPITLDQYEEIVVRAALRGLLDKISRMEDVNKPRVADTKAVAISLLARMTETGE